MTERREQRFCLCGWSVFGSDLERRNALAVHRAEEEHKKRMKKAASIEQFMDADIDRRLSE